MEALRGRWISAGSLPEQGALAADCPRGDLSGATTNNQRTFDQSHRPLQHSYRPTEHSVQCLSAMTSPRASRAARVGAGDLIRLTADELAAAPHDVLASLVDRYQDELEQTLERSEQAREEAEAARGKSDRLERELEAAKRKADEVRGEQARMEDELSGGIEALDKLRKTVRDLEGEKKDVKRQYHEQVRPSCPGKRAPSLRSTPYRPKRTRPNGRHGTIRNSTSRCASRI